MKGFLAYIPGNSLIHRLDPRTKIILPFLLCIAVFASGNIYFLLGILALNFVFGGIAGAAKKTFKVFIGLLKIMIFLFVLQILFIQRGTPLLPLIFGLNITADGLLTAVLVVIRLTSATLALNTMLSLTKMTDLSNTLVVKWHLPYKYAFAITTSIGFIPQFSNSMSEIMEAQTARGVNFDTKNPFKKIALVFPLCVPLLISSVGKIDGKAMAAELRGFNLRKRENLYKSSSFKLIDLAFLLLAVAIIALSFVL